MYDEGFEIENDSIVKAAKPVFYGFIFLSGLTLNVSAAYAGTLLGVAMLCAIAFTSAEISKHMEDRWKNFTEAIGITSILLAVLAGTYIAVSLSTI